MSIKGNNSSGLKAVGVSDTTILQNTTSTRWVVTSINLHDQFGNGDTIELFVSADSSSASAERIDKIVLAVDETKSSSFTPVALQAGEFLLGNAVTGGEASAEAIYIAYTGDS